MPSPPPLSASHTCRSTEGQQLVCSEHVCMCRRSCASPLLPHRLWSLHDLLIMSHDGDFTYHASSMWLMLGVVVVVSGVCGCLRVFVCLSSLQARVKNEILDYKDLAALPKVKAIYEVQQPDLISSSYQPYHRYTSDDRLDTYSYGEVQLPHTLDQTWHLSRHQPVFWGGTFGFVFKRFWAQKKWVLSYQLYSCAIDC